MNKKLAFVIALISIITPITEKVVMAETTASLIDSLKIRSNSNLPISQVPAATPPTPIDIVQPALKNKPIGWGEIKFTSPNSPATKLIGTDEGKIQTISTPTELSVKLLNGLNSDGDFAPTLAVDMLPYTLFKGKSSTLADYRKSGLERFLANTKLSIATNNAGDMVVIFKLLVG